jgi:radical SAM protein with 4Fe4S-binding SPASM domain
LIISTTVSNYDFIKDFDLLYRDIGRNVASWDIKRVSYAGEASANDFNYLSNTRWNEIVDFVKKYDSLNVINIFKMYDFEVLDGISDYQIDTMQSKVITNCGSGISKIYIYPNLDVLACTCYEKYPSGNLRDMDIQSVLSSSQHKKITNHEIDHAVCNTCRYKKICNGGCLGAGFYSTGSLNVPDIKCPKIYQMVNKQSLTTKLIDFVQV